MPRINRYSRWSTAVLKGLYPTQQRYSTIELECMAIVWAILKCSFYLRGLPRFAVYTDHKPLFGVFQKDIFDLASPRLQRLREKVSMFSFDVVWVPGKTHLSPWLKAFIFGQVCLTT